MKEGLFSLMLSLLYNGDLVKPQEYQIFVDESTVELSIERGNLGKKVTVVLEHRSFSDLKTCKEFGEKLTKAIENSTMINRSPIFLGYAFVGKYHAFSATYMCIQETK